MTRNLKVFLLASIFSMPLWWSIDLLSEGITQVAFAWEVNTNPEIISAFAAQKSLEQKFEQEYPHPAKGSTELTVSAKGVMSTLVKPDGTTKVLFEQRKDSPFLIASLTKLMTALVAMKSYDPHTQVVLTPEILTTEGESGQLKPFESFAVQDLLYLALIESSNDAAVALTTPMGGEAFIEEMNAQAVRLGLTHTTFRNPTGLDAYPPEATGNYASAQDFTTLGIHLAKKYPQVFDIMSQQQFKFYTPEGELHHTLINTNDLLGYKNWPTKILGGKTGWTPRAQQSLFLVVQAPDKQGYIVNVILGTDDRFGEMKNLLRWILESYQWKQ